MVLCAGPTVAHSFVDVVGHVGPVQRLSHKVVLSMFARVAGQKGEIAKVKERVS